MVAVLIEFSHVFVCLRIGSFAVANRFQVHVGVAKHELTCVTRSVVCFTETKRAGGWRSLILWLLHVFVWLLAGAVVVNPSLPYGGRNRTKCIDVHWRRGKVRGVFH